MIKVFIPPSFIPERTYIVRTLLQDHLGLDIEIIDRKGQLHYEITWDDKSIIIYDQFFGHTFVGETYLAPERIPSIATTTTDPGFHGVISIYGKEKLHTSSHSITSEVDLFAGAFFMLTRWEESFGINEDLHGRFPADKALMVKSGFILRPVVDEYVALIRAWLVQLGFTMPESKHRFTVVPTCDIDIPYYWLRMSKWKLALTHVIKNRNFKGLSETLRKVEQVRQNQLQDPYDTFDYMMSKAEERNLHFKFHMIGGGITRFDGFYSIHNPRIINLMDRFVKRGHTIGLHPSYNSSQDQGMINSEKKSVEKYSGQKISFSRQHFLRIAIPRTFSKLSEAGIKEDSTLGYAAEPGFRCGTSKPFYVFDAHARKTLPLLERPLLIMDVSLRFYKQLDIDQSIAYCGRIIDEIKKHNGELVFLWHNSNLSHQDGWDGWQRVFEYLIGQE